MPGFVSADVVRSSAKDPADSVGYDTSSPGGRIEFELIISKLLAQQSVFKDAHTVYMIVDSRLPQDVDFWPAFQPWRASRVSYAGVHGETTALLWFHIIRMTVDFLWYLTSGQESSYCW